MLSKQPGPGGAWRHLPAPAPTPAPAPAACNQHPRRLLTSSSSFCTSSLSFYPGAWGGGWELRESRCLLMTCCSPILPHNWNQRSPRIQPSPAELAQAVQAAGPQGCPETPPLQPWAHSSSPKPTIISPKGPSQGPLPYTPYTLHVAHRLLPNTKVSATPRASELCSRLPDKPTQPTNGPGKHPTSNPHHGTDGSWLVKHPG